MCLHVEPGIATLYVSPQAFPTRIPPGLSRWASEQSVLSPQSIFDVWVGLTLVKTSNFQSFSSYSIFSYVHMTFINKMVFVYKHASERS